MGRVIQDSPDGLITRVREICAAEASSCDDRVHITASVVSSSRPVNMQYVTELITGYPTGVAAFNTDIAYFTKLDECAGRAVLFGYGDICDPHCPREFIYVEDVHRCVEAYRDIATQLLGACQQGRGSS